MQNETPSLSDQFCDSNVSTSGSAQEIPGKPGWMSEEDWAAHEMAYAEWELDRAQADLQALREQRADALKVQQQATRRMDAQQFYLEASCRRTETLHAELLASGINPARLQPTE